MLNSLPSLVESAPATQEKILHYKKMMLSPVVWGEVILPDGTVALEQYLGQPEPYWVLVEEGEEEEGA